MDWRSLWLSRERRALLHTIAAFALALVVILAGEALSGLVGNAINATIYFPFYKVKTTLSHLALVADDVALLRATVVETSSRLQFYNEAMEENRRLRALMGFAPPVGFKIVPAEIFGVYGSGMPNTVLINLGERRAVRANQPVINRDGVAGRVAQVMKEYSVVYLLTEPRCRVAARIKRSREQGIVRFSMSKGMYLDNLPRQGDVVVGDTIITSGLGGIFPEGLVIGTVRSVEWPEREFFYDILIQPAVNFNALDELYVLVPEY